MILKFKHQPFQSTAVSAVVDIFKGQSRRTDTFTIVNEAQTAIDEGFGIRNVLELSDAQIVANMNEVQKRHSLQLTDDINCQPGSGRQFCVEM
jgi:type III restriction enzyme